MVQEKVKNAGRVIQRYLDQYFKMLKKSYWNMSEDLATDTQNIFPISNNMVFREWISFYLSVLEIWTLSIYSPNFFSGRIVMSVEGKVLINIIIAIIFLSPTYVLSFLCYSLKTKYFTICYSFVLYQIKIPS